MSVILKAENISKQYRLGTVGTGTLSDDLKRWWFQLRGKEDPFMKVGSVNSRDAKALEDYVWALRDINFEVKQGEVLGIIGKNGAGKSTLLKILSRITAPTTGSIKTRGRIASLLEVGTGFHPELTGRENIYLNGAILGMTKPEIRAKIDEIIAFSGCEMYIDTPVKRYSSGMRVRLGFAVAAHLEPEILVVDEVLAVGDAEFQKKAIGKMQDLSTGEGRTVIFVSHNMLSIKNLCTRSIVLENGKTVFEGETDSAVGFYISKKEKLSYFNPIRRLVRSEDVEILNIRIINNKGDSIDKILSGEEVHIEISISKKGYLNPLEVGIGFYSAEEEPQFHCATKTIKKSYQNDLNFFIATLIIPKWPLSQGLFYINAYIKEGTKLLEHLEESLWIECEKGDYYGTGILPSWNKGFYCEYDWK